MQQEGQGRWNEQKGEWRDTGQKERGGKGETAREGLFLSAQEDLGPYFQWIGKPLEGTDKVS